MRLLTILLLCGAALALENAVGRKPALGYNTWNAFGISIDEDIVKATAQRMIDLGLRDAGYVYLNVDDAWSEPVRVDGKLIGNRATFPSGIKALADYVHSKGLKFGIYSDAGSHTCAGFPGSRGYEAVDAQTWADWGVDYLKYDNCFAPASDWIVDRYVAMRDALNETDRPVLYSLCEWGVADPWLWAPEVGNSWRTTEDIEPTWSSILKILDYSTGLARFAGPGHFGDLDMLEVGNGELTLGEQRAHFALWALFKSPLLIGADLRTIHPDSLAILKAREVIAINQDELGVAGDLIWQQGASRVYAAPLAGGGRAVVLLNLHTPGGQYVVSNISVSWEELGLPAGTPAAVRDLYATADLGTFTDSFTAEVTAHDVRVVRIVPLGGLKHDSWRPWFSQTIRGPTSPMSDSGGTSGTASDRKMFPGQHSMFART
ncbi:hypothetical protein ABPG75_013611 [Micractinium tetrahymenae]